MKKTLLPLIVFAAMSGVIAITYGFSKVIEGVHDAERPLELSIYYVGTPAGEVYRVEANHQCGDALMKAALRATNGQRDLLTFPKADLILGALIRDWTRIYDGDVKNRCYIESIKINKVTIPGDE